MRQYQKIERLTTIICLISSALTLFYSYQKIEEEKLRKSGELEQINKDCVRFGFSTYCKVEIQYCQDAETFASLVYFAATKISSALSVLVVALGISIIYRRITSADKSRAKFIDDRSS